MIYGLILAIRHKLYDWGWKKSYPTEVRSICVGNVGVGGTGKTPMTELIIRTIDEGNVESADAEIYGFVGSLFDQPRQRIAVLSRGYKRSTKGFQQVVSSGTAAQYGDEPLQIKRKFPFVTVAVDRDRVRACDLLAHPEHLDKLEQKEPVNDPVFEPADVIIMDDAMQHRRIKPTRTIVLTTYDRPYFNDRLLPWGMLRDLKGRVRKADAVIVTKCPPVVDEWERSKWIQNVGLKLFDPATCTGINADGKKQLLLFSTTVYDKLQAVFPEGDPRYIHSKMAILFSGIANDTPLAQWISEKYRIVDHKKYPDHHFFTTSDIDQIDASAQRSPMAMVVTTEKDAQRMRDGSSLIREMRVDSDLKVSDTLRRRTFFAPIRSQMLTAAEQDAFRKLLVD